MSIKTLNVHLHHNNKKLHAGRIALKERTIYFEYDKEFLKSGIQLSPYKLPLKKGVHICDDRVFDGLFGVFSDSLPDGWGRLLLDRHLMSKGIKFHEITPLDRLGYIGEYGIGALSYEPVLNSFRVDENSIMLDAMATSSLEILKGTGAEFLETLLAIGGSSAGARPKIMVQINDANEIIHGSQQLQSGYEHFMVKFPSASDTQEIGKLEYIYSQMAHDAKIEMPITKLLQTQHSSYFAIKRFDRNKDARVHIHSAAGLVHSDFRLPSLDYDDLLSLTLHLTKDVNEMLKMFKLACFNLFAHNRDDHAKNFSYMLDENKHWKLSPAYDLTFSYGPGGEHSTTYLREGAKPTEEHLKQLAVKHDIKDATKTINEVKSVVKNFKIYAQNVGLSKNTTQDVFSNFMI